MPNTMLMYAVVMTILLIAMFVKTRKHEYSAVLHIDFKDENDQYIKLEFLDDFETICKKKHINVKIDVQNKE